MNKRGFLGLPLGDDNPTTRIPIFNWSFIALNIIVFLISLTNHEAIVRAFGFTPIEFSIITIFTSMFLHAGLAHIAGNMWFLFIFGDNIEDRLGHMWYVVFYLACGVAATIAHFATNMSSSIPAVGASGAISGVLGAYLVFYPHAGVYMSGGLGHSGKVPAWMMLILWFGYQLFSGFLGFFGANSGVAFWAHVGGFVAGVLIALLIKSVQRDKKQAN